MATIDDLVDQVADLTTATTDLTTTASGQIDRLTAAADQAAADAGAATGNPLGDYATGLVFNSHNDYTKDDVLYKLKDSVGTPYTTNATTYPAAIDDPNLVAWSNVDVLKSIALALNVPREGVVFGVAGQVITSQTQYLYNPVDQTTWSLPAGVGVGEVIISVTGNQLETGVSSPSTYNLLKVATNNSTLDILDFGGIGGGIADDTIALNKAFADIAENGTKITISRKHRHTGTLSIVTSKNVDIEFIGEGEIITDAAMADQTALWVSHLPYALDTAQYYDPANRSNGVALTANTVKGYSTITVADGSGFAKGDYIYIISTNDYLASASIKKGESRKISAVAGNVITLDGGIDDNYFFAGTTVFKYNPPKVSIKNIKMTGADDANGLIGLNLYECASVDISHPTVTGYNLRDIQLSFCVGGIVSNPNNDFADKPGASSSYSLVLGSSRDITVLGGALRGGRHSFSTGGYIPCRNINATDLVCYSSDIGGNGRACFDTHEGMVNFRAKGCTVYGGVNISGENLDFSGNTVHLTDNDTFRAIEIRVYKNTNYVKANDNLVFNTDGVGGVVVRHREDNVLIDKVEQNGNIVFMTTAFSRVGVGLEPKSGIVGAKIRQLSQKDNYIDIRGSSVGAVGIGNFDVADGGTLIEVNRLLSKDNYVFNEAGTPMRYDCDGKGIGDIERNTLIAENDANASFTITSFSQLAFDKNHCAMSLGALAANKANLFDDIDTLNLNGGSIENSYYNGYRLLNVTEHNPVNLKLINCVINPSSVNRHNAKFIADNWINSAATGVETDSYRCAVSKTGTGQYLIAFGNSKQNSAGYPMFATAQGVGFAQCTYNNVNSCYVTTRDPSGVAADMAFSFISY